VNIASISFWITVEKLDAASANHLQNNSLDRAFRHLPVAFLKHWRAEK